jgi:hypothetical protein
MYLKGNYPADDCYFFSCDSIKLLPLSYEEVIIFINTIYDKTDTLTCRLFIEKRPIDYTRQNLNTHSAYYLLSTVNIVTKWRALQLVSLVRSFFMLEIKFSEVISVLIANSELDMYRTTKQFLRNYLQTVYPNE